MLCTFEFGNQINNLLLSLSHSQVSRKKRHGRVLSDGHMGEKGGWGFMHLSLVIAGSFIACYFMFSGVLGDQCGEEGDRI